MNSQVNDDDDDDDLQINPFTMLLLSDDEYDHQTQEQQGEKKSPALDSTAANQHLQLHHIKSIESTVVIRQIPSEGISFQLWPAAAALVSLLDHHRRDPTTSPLAATLSAHQRRLRILELGAGTGLFGIAAAAALGADVTVTDLHHVLPNLKFNADANSDLISKHGGTVDVAPLCWGEVDQMEAINREYDLVLGSDVVYHDHLYDPLIRTLRFLLLERESNVVFLMAHLRRWKKESAFFKKAKKLFEIEIINRDVPLNGSRIGVVLYRFVRKGCNSKVLVS